MHDPPFYMPLVGLKKIRSLSSKPHYNQKIGKSEPEMKPFSDGGPGAGFVVAWGFGRYVPEASAGMGKDSEKPGIRLGPCLTGTIS